MRSIFRFVCMSESRQQGSFMSSFRLLGTNKIFLSVCALAVGAVLKMHTVI